MLLCFIVVPLAIAILSILLLIYKEIRIQNALIADKSAATEAKPKLVLKKRRSVRPTDKARNWLDTRTGNKREAV